MQDIIDKEKDIFDIAIDNQVEIALYIIGFPKNKDADMKSLLRLSLTCKHFYQFVRKNKKLINKIFSIIFQGNNLLSLKYTGWITVGGWIIFDYLKYMKEEREFHRFFTKRASHFMKIILARGKFEFLPYCFENFPQILNPSFWKRFLKHFICQDTKNREQNNNSVYFLKILERGINDHNINILCQVLNVWFQSLFEKEIKDKIKNSKSLISLNPNLIKLGEIICENEKLYNLLCKEDHFERNFTFVYSFKFYKSRKIQIHLRKIYKMCFPSHINIFTFISLFYKSFENFFHYFNLIKNVCVNEIPIKIFKDVEYGTTKSFSFEKILNETLDQWIEIFKDCNQNFEPIFCLIVLSDSFNLSHIFQMKTFSNLNPCLSDHFWRFIFSHIESKVVEKILVRFLFEKAHILKNDNAIFRNFYFRILRNWNLRRFENVKHLLSNYASFQKEKEEIKNIEYFYLKKGLPHQEKILYNLIIQKIKTLSCL